MPGTAGVLELGHWVRGRGTVGAQGRDMTKGEIELQAQLTRLEAQRQVMQAALDNVRQLLDKADERRAVDGERRWDQILDNLEQALDTTASKLTACDQQIKEVKRRLRDLLQGGMLEGQGDEASGPQEPLVSDRASPAGKIDGAKRIMALPVDQLRDLTIEQLTRIHSRLFEAEPPEAAPAQQAQTPERSSLSARIEQAQRSRRRRAARPRRPAVSFVERRKQHLLRGAVAKATTDKVAGMTLEEIDLVLNWHKTLDERAGPTEGDRRLLDLLDPFIGKLKERASQLRHDQTQRKMRGRP